MSEERKFYCPNCNATYSVGTKTCRSCGSTLETGEQLAKANILNGMPLEDWHTFIGKNSSDYIDVFKKNETKHLFFSFNVFAFIFGPYWMVYRKMYKYALIYYVLTIVFTLCFLIAGLAINSPKIIEAVNKFEPYTEYMTFSGKKTSEFPQNEELQKEINEAYDEYEDVINDISLKSALFSRLGNIIVVSVAPFLANCLYREHILNHTVRRKGYVANSGSGGVSIGSALALYIFGESVLSAIISLVSTIALFILTGI